MSRVGSVVRLRPDKQADYLRLHQQVWPEVLDRIHQSNIRNYSIFLLDGLLFSYFEYVGTDYAADMAAMAADPVTQDWWRLTDPCQEPLESAADGSPWARLEEVFHVD